LAMRLNLVLDKQSDLMGRFWIIYINIVWNY